MSEENRPESERIPEAPAETPENTEPSPDPGLTPENHPADGGLIPVDNALLFDESAEFDSFFQWPTDEQDAVSPEGQDASGTENYREYSFVHAEQADRDEEEPEDSPGAPEGSLSSFLSGLQRKRSKKKKTAFLQRAIPIVVAIAIVVGFVLYVFRLQHLYFDNLTGYPPEEVFAATGIRKNQLIFLINRDTLRRNLAREFPYIEDIRVELKLPDTVHLVFEEDCALFYTVLYGEYFVISESLRVLERYDREEDVPSGLRCILLPSVSYAVVGFDLSFFDATFGSFLKSFLDTLESQSFYSKVNSMDLSNRNYLSITYENRLIFDLGSDADIETKFLFVKSIIKELGAAEKGTVTLIDNKKAVFSSTSRTQ